MTSANRLTVLVDEGEDVPSGRHRTPQRETMHMMSTYIGTTTPYSGSVAGFVSMLLGVVRR